MSKKNSTIINIVAFISLAIFGYLLFFTVYRQMISQNEGFFYVIVFGGILVLVYILLSLMTKLLAFSNEGTENPILIVLEILFVLIFSFLFVKLRINYSTSVPAEESVIYRSALLINQESLDTGGMDLFSQLLNNPQSYIMSHFIAFIFLFTGEIASYVIYINTALLLLLALVVYLITRRLSSRICSLVSFVICLFMPALGFSVYSYNGQILFALLLSLAFYFTIIPITQSNSNALTIVSCVLAGLFWGLTIASEPASFLILIAILLLNRKKRLSFKMSVLMLILSLSFFMGIAFVKSFNLNVSFGNVLNGFITSCNPFSSDSGNNHQIDEVFSLFNDNLDSQQKAINDNYYFLTGNDGATYSSIKIAWLQLGNQVLYMFMIILSIACAFYMIRSKHPRAIPILSGEIASFVVIFLCSGKDYNIVFFIILLIISGSISLQYMYENHHALADEAFKEYFDEEEDKKDTETEEEISEIDESMFMLRAQALIFIGANENYYQQIKSEEKLHKEQLQLMQNTEVQIKENIVDDEQSLKSDDAVNTIIDEVPTDIEENDIPIEYLEAPLPLPPKHVPKKLDYDNNVNNDDDLEDFDIEWDDSLDFDVD